MKSVISWYEVSYQMGLNISAGLPVLFTGYQVRIGFFKLDKLNIVNFIIAILSFILAIVSYFKVVDLSKNLERTEFKCKLNCSPKLSDSKLVLGNSPTETISKPEKTLQSSFKPSKDSTSSPTVDSRYKNSEDITEGIPQ